MPHSGDGLVVTLRCATLHDRPVLDRNRAAASYGIGDELFMNRRVDPLRLPEPGTCQLYGDESGPGETADPWVRTGADRCR